MVGRFLYHMGSPCFSVLMLAQVVFWLYLCVGISDTLLFARARGVQGQDLREKATKRPLVDQEGPERANDEMHGRVDATSLTGGAHPYVNPLDKFLAQTNKQSLNTTSGQSSGELNGTDILRRFYNTQVGHTILPRDALFLLNGPYLVNPTTLCSRHNSDLDLVVVVHSSPYNFKRRQIMRANYQDPRVVQPYTVQLVFILGTHNDSTRNDMHEATLMGEMEENKDFVQMDFQENFRNLSYKAVTWLRWLDEACPNAMMVLKIDDDTVVDLRRVLPMSLGYFSKFKRSIFCNVNREGFQPIPRIGRTKVDPREFYNLTVYPYTYCSGFVVFLSRDMVRVLAQAVRQAPFYNVDDVFMFGMVPYVAGDVNFHNIGYNVSIWSNKVKACTVQDGVNCRYYATMAQEEREAMRVLEVMEHAHRNDFRPPQTRITRRQRNLNKVVLKG